MKATDMLVGFSSGQNYEYLFLNRHNISKTVLNTASKQADTTFLA